MSGRLETPTANLECFPCSPNTLTIISEAPLIIVGCDVKDEAEATNPPNFTTLETLLRSPSQADFNWLINARAVSYTHLTLPTMRTV